MEEWIDRIKEAVATVLVTGLLFWLVYGLWYTIRHLADIVEERKVSRKRMRSKKKEEAQAISDGATILLDQLKKAGTLNDKGYAHWQKKLKSIGLKDIGQEASFGKPWYEPVVTSMVALRKRLVNSKKKEVRTLEEQFAHCEVK